MYEGRRGDSLAALSARFGGDENLTKTLSREAGRAADVPFDAGERVTIPFESLKGHRDVIETFALVREARERRARGDYAAALAAFKAAYAARADEPAVAFELGATYYEAGDYARGAGTLARANALAPQDEEVILMLALATAEAGDAAKGATLLRELAAARPDFRYGLYVLGELDVRAGDYPAGRHYLFEYLKSNGEGLVAAYAREAIKASARAEMEAAARALEKAGAAKEEAGPPREAGPGPGE